MFRLIAPVLGFMAISPQAAQDITVYKCTIKGVATFSQTPCAENAEIIKLKQPLIADKVSNNANTQAMPGASVDNYIEIQKIEREIKRHQLTIKNYKEDLAHATQQASYINQDQANRMGAASIADAIATKTTAIQNRYNALISAVEQQISILQQQKQQLSNQP
ncbi:RNA-binding protein [uncultured Pseudoalteromonas sp.]|uniref:RNA-binding protein n=1 Tax=uncultured Pseudoalteromonas sp. TaxID=114053 RepID=UPI0030C858DF